VATGVPPVEEQLAELVREAEAKLDEVRRELAERREQDAQHAEIDRLAEHLAQTTVRWGEVRGFFDEVITELRAPGEPPEGTEQ
jgi:hypothetical protein